MPKTLLLLDDEEAHRFFAVRAIKATWPSYLIIESGDIATARTQLAEYGRNVAIFLIDLNVGNESGLTLVKQIRQDPMLANRPILLLSTSELQSDIESAYLAGVSAFLFKGTDIAAFGRELAGAIRFFVG